MHKSVLPFIAATFFLLAGCMGCGNEISQVVMSPSGKLKAVVFNRNCGATTGFNTQISIIPATEELPNDSGNTFIADDSFPVTLSWASENTLQVMAHSPGRVFKQQSNVKGVSVHY